MSRSVSDLERSRCMRIAVERFRMPCRSMPSSAAAQTAYRQSGCCHAFCHPGARLCFVAPQQALLSGAQLPVHESCHGPPVGALHGSPDF